MFIPPSTSRRRSVAEYSRIMLEPAPITVRWLIPEPGEERKTCVIRSVRLPWDVARDAVERVRQARESGRELDTEHALLVAWGLFAQQMGLLKGLEDVPVNMGTGVYTPQTKLIEFFIAVLAGVDRLRELNEGERPLAEDVSLAVAWLREGLAHYSGVSRTLKAADARTVEATLKVLDTVSQPFVQREVAEILRRQGCLDLDVDLTGRPVSNTSRTYPDSRFGWMDDEVRLGYQAALLSLSGQAASRRWVVGQHLPGNARPGECLRGLIRAAEDKLKVRPCRRVALVAWREAEVTQAEIAAYQAATGHLAHASTELAQVAAWRAELAQAESRRDELEQAYGDAQRPERPHSHLARARQQVAQLEQRIHRGLKAVETHEQRARQLDATLARLEAERQTLMARRAELEVDNQSNPNPVSIRMRVDAGFGSGAEIAWLIEMGYTVYTKAYSNKVTQAMRRRLPADAVWSRVGANAEMTFLASQALKQCPYPVELGLARYTQPDQTLYVVLVRYDPDRLQDTDLSHALKVWFDTYNARQIIEAGIREGKSVLTLRKPLVRSPAGLELQLHFALFGANLIRWAAQWMRDLVCQTNQAFLTALAEVKAMVTVGAHSAARWVRTTAGACLVWPDQSPYAGTILWLSGLLACQLSLPLWNVQKT
jgi:hypothetical protein